MNTTTNTQIISVVEGLIEQYKNDSYMSFRIENFFCNQLASLFRNMKETHDYRVQRIEDLTSDQDNFIQLFLNRHQYFYVSVRDEFYVYRDGVFQPCTEDDILCDIMINISECAAYRHLAVWKQRTCAAIIRRIKESMSLVNAVPDQSTVQTVLDHLFPILFSSRHEAKYFLTILGDNLRRTPDTTSLVHLISPHAKPFLIAIQQAAMAVFGTSATSSFRVKYHDHDYEQCRLVRINDTVVVSDYWKSVVTYYAIEILIVGSYFSSIFESSDKFVERTGANDGLDMTVFMLRNTTPEKLVERFVEEYIQTSVATIATATITTNMVISWASMQFLWKQFLETNRLPAVVFQQALKPLLQRLVHGYNEENDAFFGVSSKYLPAIARFLTFWRDTMVVVAEEDDTEFPIVFEIEEVANLFRKWLRLSSATTDITDGSVTVTNTTTPMVSDEQIISMIIHFFPHFVDPNTQKCIRGVRSTLWDKNGDIERSLEHFREQSLLPGSITPAASVSSFDVAESNSTNSGGGGGGADDDNTSTINSPSSESTTSTKRSATLVSLYDAYIFYCKLFSQNATSFSQIASNAYFNSYVQTKCAPFMVNAQFISSAWFASPSDR